MRFRSWGNALLLAGLAACGGGDGGSGADPAPAPAPAPSPQVSITLSSPATRVPTEVIAWFDLVVANQGPVAATGLQARRQLPAGLTDYFDVVCEASGGAVCPEDAATLAVPSLPAGGALRFRYFVWIDIAARGPNLIGASVTASNLDGTRRAELSIEGYRADIAASGTAPAGELPPGAPAGYTLELTNHGPDAASDVVIHHVPDPELSLSSITCTATGGAVCPAETSTPMRSSWLPVGGRLSFAVTAVPWPGTVGPVTHSLRTSAWGDPDPHNNQATARANVAAPANPGTLIQLQSDAGDYIGQGDTYVYDRANALITARATGARLELSAWGTRHWTASFRLPDGMTRLQPGTFANLARESAGSPLGGLDWGGDGRACNSLTGTIVIDEAVYTGDALERLDLRFEQHCEHAAPALRGRVRWLASDSTPPPAPVSPVPAGLWRPAPAATPASGSYLYLREEPYSPTGTATERVYTPADSQMSVDANAWRLDAVVQGDERWILNLRTMENLSELLPGFYRGLGEEMNPARGSFWIESIGHCDRSMGWVAIDSVAYTAGILSSIDLRFERRCDVPTYTLHGRLHWVAGDTTQPPGPLWPLPAGLWAPPAGSTPATGSYVYLESDAGDYIGQGVTRLFTPATTAMRVTGSGRLARIHIPDGLGWHGDFLAMSSVARLTPGYYPGLLRWGSHNPARGGLSWDGDGRACNQATGWFVVDSVSYVGDELQSLELRFEQHCEGMQPALRGKIRWVN